MTMWPGYGGEAYHPPIQALHVEPLRTGRRELRLEFLNIGYAAGVQVMAYELRTLIRQRGYMLCAVERSERAIALVPLTERWLASLLPAAHNSVRVIMDREGMLSHRGCSTARLLMRRAAAENHKHLAIQSCGFHHLRE